VSAITKYLRGCHNAVAYFATDISKATNKSL
jgi:hypothetical protein